MNKVPIPVCIYCNDSDEGGCEWCDPPLITDDVIVPVATDDEIQIVDDYYGLGLSDYEF